MTARDYVMTIGDGTVTETLTSSPYALMDYIPNAPNPDMVDSLSNSDVVSETCIIRVIDGSVSNNIAEIQSIQTLLDQGKKAQKDSSLAKVYVTFKNSAAGTEYRAEIKGGKVEYDEEALSYVQWANDVFLIKIFWNRTWYWEATTAVQIALDNLIDTANTTGLTIYNPNILITADTIAFVEATKKITDSGNGLAHFKTGATIQVIGSTSNDGTYTIATGGVAGEIVTNEALVNEGAAATVTIVGPQCNYVEIPAAQVATVIDAPIRLEITNAQGEGLTYKDLHAGTSHMADIANMVWFFEGESATTGGGASASVDTESALCSGGFYNALSWVDDTEKEIATWDLTAAMLAACRGGNIRVLLRLQGGTIAATLQFKMSIKLSTTTLWSSPLITCKANDYKQDLGIIQLPPQLFGQTAPKALTLALTTKKAGGGTINLDFLEMFPQDTFRALRSLNYEVADGDDIFVDELNNPPQAYGVDSGAKKYPIWIKRGIPLKVKNNTKQRIYIVFDEQNYNWIIKNKSTIKVYYRPRRLSL